MKGRVCPIRSRQIKYIDYKNVELLKQFLDEYGRILPRRKTGVCRKNQKKLAVAVKRARFLGLLPYVQREEEWV